MCGILQDLEVVERVSKTVYGLAAFPKLTAGERYIRLSNL